MNVLVKLFGIAVSLGAGAIANKTLEGLWQKKTGKPAPKDGTDLDDSLPGVLVFAIVSAAVGAVVHVLTQRGTKSALAHMKKTADEV
ncbi:MULTISPECIES: DUF4235 domain-containing protein [unclassified Arthrobacter]|uniref:DUF4235 domain-containing protein n=1 Tax=unclassified Arthrobacter TaxID=235627 RepID=UPI00254DB020|nr:MULTISPECIES: DUF4235 domain-containing protein [unclassified Arthrobacter]